MGAWTTYGKQQIFATGVGAQPMPQLYVALYVGSADPAGPPVELTLAGYGRRAVSFVLTSADHGASTSDVAFGPLAAGAYQGVSILDDPVAGGVWFWDDESGSIPIAGSSMVDFAAGALTVVRA